MNQPHTEALFDHKQRASVSHLRSTQSVIFSSQALSKTKIGPWISLSNITSPRRNRRVRGRALSYLGDRDCAGDEVGGRTLDKVREQYSRKLL